MVLVAETINTWITVSSPWAARLRRHGGSRPWLLFEWDDHNNIHELPPGTDPGGRVGVGNTNSEGDYIPYWNRNGEGDKAS